MTTQPSATPRTDAATNYCDANPVMPWVSADFARTLETELAKAKAECERLRFSTEGHLLKTIQQQTELARLRDEVERLTIACDKFSNDEITQGDWKARAERAEAALAAARKDSERLDWLIKEDIVKYLDRDAIDAAANAEAKAAMTNSNHKTT